MMDRPAVHKLGFMELQTHKTDWEELASLDPMWAVLSETDKRGNKWNAEEFFNTGKNEIDGLMAELNPIARSRGKALDFGCGVGRLTRALLGYYGEAHGVDVSASMIEKAKQFTPQCDFHLNESQDLSLFPDKTFDLVYSNRVLQHLPSSAMIGNYVREFFRVAAPGGLVVFQVPSRKSYRNIFNVKRSAYHLLKGLGLRSEVIFTRFKLHPMRMTAISQEHARLIIHESSGELIKEQPDKSAHFAVLYYCRRLVQQTVTL
jgi:ubiquinone/menaquinone biosynthesis C-methylase UbiE